MCNIFNELLIYLNEILPALGAGSRPACWRDRPDQPSFEAKRKTKVAATELDRAKAGHQYGETSKLRLGTSVFAFSFASTSQTSLDNNLSASHLFIMQFYYVYILQSERNPDRFPQIFL